METRGLSSNHWKTPTNYDASWVARVEWMASRIPSEVTSIVDFGSGKCVLRDLVGQKLKYTAVDLTTDLGADIAIDLNSPFERNELPIADMGFMSGVVEYLCDFRFVLFTAPRYPWLLISYNPISTPFDRHRLIPSRRKLGWVNDYTSGELICILEHAGYRVLQLERFTIDLTKPNNNTLFLARSGSVRFSS